MPGIKHLISCHCTLAIYKNNQKTIFHKFPVYSKTKDDVIVPKLVKCNNCDTLHKVYDYCKSEIVYGKDQSGIVMTKEDLSLSLPDKIVNMLTSTNSDISVWEHILDIIDEKRWGEFVVFKREIIGEKQHVKILEILSESRFKIKNETIENIILK